MTVKNITEDEMMIRRLKGTRIPKPSLYREMIKYIAENVKNDKITLDYKYLAPYFDNIVSDTTVRQNYMTNFVYALELADIVKRETNVFTRKSIIFDVDTSKLAIPYTEFQNKVKGILKNKKQFLEKEEMKKYELTPKRKVAEPAAKSEVETTSQKEYSHSDDLPFGDILGRLQDYTNSSQETVEEFEHYESEESSMQSKYRMEMDKNSTSDMRANETTLSNPSISRDKAFFIKKMVDELANINSNHDFEIVIKKQEELYSYIQRLPIFDLMRNREEILAKVKEQTRLLQKMSRR